MGGRRSSEAIVCRHLQAIGTIVRSLVNVMWRPRKARQEPRTPGIPKTRPTFWRT
jgi:hypothetical protein